MRLNRILAAVAATTFLVGGSVSAAIVNPGQTITDDEFDTPVPVGDLIDEDVREITLQYVAPDGFGFQNVTTSADITFRAQVYRDPATQRLSFVYSWADEIVDFGPEGGTTTVRSFSGFTADVTGELRPGGTINRSADGSTISGVAALGPGLGPAQLLIVATNATEYDEGGSVEANVLDELFLINLETQEVVGPDVVSAPVSLTGTFQPITDIVNPVIPLPAGVWGGLVMLGGAAGIARRFRRR